MIDREHRMNVASESFPDQIEIRPISKLPKVCVRLPGSKSITNRALVLGALCHSRAPCILEGALRSQDTEVMVNALGLLGFPVECSWSLDIPTITVRAPDIERDRDAGEASTSLIPRDKAHLFLANSGTSMRFLTALVSLGHGTYRLDGDARMRERPIGDLLRALEQLGVSARSERGDDCPPVVVDGSGIKGGTVRLRGEVSSQFLSALLLVAPCTEGDLHIEVEGRLVSKPYVEMTLKMVDAFGGSVEGDALRSFSIRGGQRYHGRRFPIEPDASAASYFFGAAAVTGGQVTVLGLRRGTSIQGDTRFVELLEQMGCTVTDGESGLTLCGGSLHGIDADLTDMSDCAMTLAAVACFASGPTTIRGISHIRHKETDRIRALATELARVGVGVEEVETGLCIRPSGRMHGACIETYNDHRMAMSFAILGLRIPGIVIDSPGCVAKTYPEFFSDWMKLYEA